jgi:hypothetical protein
MMLRRRVVLILAVVAVAASACGSGHPNAGSATTTALPTFKADTSWDGAVLSVDGRTLQIGIPGEPKGDGPCEERFVYRVTETKQRVTVAFRSVVNPTATTAPVACPLVLSMQRFTIRLRSPLGTRPLYDGVKPQAQPVWRKADIVDATVLPAGVAHADLLSEPASPAPNTWSQTAQVASGPGWDFFIDQGPAGTFVAPTTAPAKIVATTKVHGHDANVYEYFSSTGREIHWTENGLDITVRAELHTSNLRAPQSFANPEVAFVEPTLIRVANGIVEPRTA